MLARFINKVMLQGKNLWRTDDLRRAEIVGEKTGRDPMEVFTQALGNAMPLVEVARAESVVRPLKFRWRFVLTAGKRWGCDGGVGFARSTPAGRLRRSSHTNC